MTSPHGFVKNSAVKRTHLQIKEHFIDRRAKYYLTVGMNYMRQHLRKCMTLLAEREAIIVTNNGKKTAVLLDYDAYVRMLTRHRIMLEDGVSHSIPVFEAEYLNRRNQL